MEDAAKHIFEHLAKLRALGGPQSVVGLVGVEGARTLDLPVMFLVLGVKLLVQRGLLQGDDYKPVPGVPEVEGVALPHVLSMTPKGLRLCDHLELLGFHLGPEREFETYSTE